jgi:membrane protein
MPAAPERQSFLALYWRIFVDAAGQWLAHNAFVHAASLAFYTIFSLAPVGIVAIAVVGLVIGEEAARGQIVGYLNGFMGESAAKAVEDAIANARPEVAGGWQAIVGVGALLLGAGTVFGQMQFSLNQMWGVETKREANDLIVLIRTRLLSMAIVPAIGFVLLVSLLVDVAVRSAVHYAEGRLGVAAIFIELADLILGTIAVAGMFAVIYKVLPDVRLAWRDVAVGAVAAAILFAAGRYLFALYLTYSAPGSAYGAAGALVLLLMWVYYSALILLFGAALTKARRKALGKSVEPRRMAQVIQ